MVEYMILLGVVALAALAGYSVFGTEMHGVAGREAECVRTFSCGNVASQGAMPSGNGIASGPSGGTPTTWAPHNAVAESTGALANTLNFGKGFALEAWDAVVGTVEAVRHPVDTAKGIAFAVQNPSAAWGALSAEWGSRGGAENAGRATLEVVSMVGPGAFAKLGKVASVASVAGKAGEATKAAEVARIVARAPEKTRLGEGAFSIAYKQGDHVIKEIKDVVPGVGDVAIRLSAADKARLAETVSELTNEVGAHMGGTMVPRLDVAGPGMLRQPVVEGKTMAELAKGDFEAADRATRNMSDATGKAAKGVGLDSPYGYLETPDGWHAIIDTNPANFRFDSHGNITSWFDPVAVFPKATP
jgi:hypothetical protein